MKQNAIYSLTEDGKTTHAYAKHGGSVYTAFLTLQSAKNMISQPKGDSGTASKLRIMMPSHLPDQSFPDETTPVFELIESDQAIQMRSAMHYSADVAMHIMMNLDRDHAYFDYNLLCYQKPLPMSFHIPISTGMHYLNEIAAESVRSNAVSVSGGEEAIQRKIQDNKHINVMDNLGNYIVSHALKTLSHTNRPALILNFDDLQQTFGVHVTPDERDLLLDNIFYRPEVYKVDLKGDKLRIEAEPEYIRQYKDWAKALETQTNIQDDQLISEDMDQSELGQSMQM